MRFYSMRDWKADQDLDKNELPGLAKILAYDRHLIATLPRLPRSVRRLLGFATLHDGRLLELDYQSRLNRLRLRVCALDLATEGAAFHHLSLVYRGVERLQSYKPAGEAFGGDGYGDIGCDEWDVTHGGLFQHRILFSTGIELSVTFAGFGLRSLPPRLVEQEGGA